MPFIIDLEANSRYLAAPDRLGRQDQLKTTWIGSQSRPGLMPDDLT